MELNHRRAALQATALPTELPVRQYCQYGADGESRTRNRLLTRQLLCRFELRQPASHIWCGQINDFTCPLWTGRELGDCLVVDFRLGQN